MSPFGNQLSMSTGLATRTLLAMVAILQLAGGMVVPVALQSPSVSGAVGAKICPCAPAEKPVACCCGTGCCSTPGDDSPEQQQAVESPATRLLLVPALAVRNCRGGDEGVSAAADSGPLFLQAFPEIRLATAPAFASFSFSEVPVCRADLPDSPPPRS